MCVCKCGYVCMHVHAGALWSPGESIRFPEAVATSVCEPPDVSSGNWCLVIWKSRTTESVPSPIDLISTDRMWIAIEKLHRMERQPEGGRGTLHSLGLSLGGSFWCDLTRNPVATEFRDFTKSRSPRSRGFCSSSVRCWESHFTSPGFGFLIYTIIFLFHVLL